MSRLARRFARPLFILFTLAAVVLSATRLTLSGDLTPLFPDKGEAAALGRFTRAFGGGDLAMLLLTGPDPEQVAEAGLALEAALATKGSVQRVAGRVPSPPPLDPTLAWVFAGPTARAALALAVTPEGMRARLDETRAMLLAPGAGAGEDFLARDPLRLASIPWGSRSELAAGLTASEDGSFVADQGRARLVVAQPRGSAFDGVAAATFVSDAQAAMSAVHAAHPSVTLALSGGHAIAQATEQMIRRDLEVSGTVSLVLASLVFLVTFRRARALLAVLPPLLVGTLWTTGLVAVVTPGLSAISIGFMAVVVGVGVDTGVHVYSALLDARRAGLPPREAAARARRDTLRPTLLAAAAAGLAFASLAVSDLAAVRQLGVLCGLGEVLTAIAILLMTPEIGAFLERGAPPPPLAPRWVSLVHALTKTRFRAAVALGLSLVPVLVLVVLGPPRAGDAVVALRPKKLLPLVAQDAIYQKFGGEPGQWVVLSTDADGARAMARSDAVAEALEGLEAHGDVAGFDALTRFAPAEATQRARLAARDRLDLPARAADLAAALRERGFDLEACASALQAFAHPSEDLVRVNLAGPMAWLVSRHRAEDRGDTLAAIFVRPRGTPDADARALAAIHAADPGAVVTGYAHLEAALKKTLAHDLPRVALAALLVVAVTLRAALGKLRGVLLALLTVVVEIGAVAMLMRVFDVRWHVYDALVLPVLIGITIDEAMFLLHAADTGTLGRRDAIEHTLRAQGPLVASTALTTAAGFGALLACQFDGIADMGLVGAIGSVAGLLCALVLVPAGLRLTTARSARADV